MLVGLYTSRIVLQALGVEDYGIYNVVGSFIVAFTFISGPLGTATQRFLNFELGKGESGKLNKVFNLSFYTYIVLLVFLFVIIEVAGMWFLNNKMQLPAERMNVAVFAFHTSVLTLLLNLIKTPFDSLMIAYEKMSFYAYISIADVLLKLLNAFMLLYVAIDKLKLFSINILVITLIVVSITVFYCMCNFKKVRIESPRKNWDLPLFKELMSFSGWSLFGSVANMTANQGLNILLNLFFGVVVNAAMGVATQVSAAINQFVSNFQVAFKPQLIKYYAAGEFDALIKLIMNVSKYSYLLLFALVCPIIFNMDLILHLWLKNPPHYASGFCVMMLIYALLESLSAPMWMTVQATGKIKKYQIIISACIFMNIFVSYFLLKKGFAPISVLVAKCAVDVACMLVRLVFIKRMIAFEVIPYLKKVLLPLFVVSVLGVALFILLSAYNGMFALFLKTVAFYVILFLSVFAICLDKYERKSLCAVLKSKIVDRK